MIILKTMVLQKLKKRHQSQLQRKKINQRTKSAIKKRETKEGVKPSANQVEDPDNEKLSDRKDLNKSVAMRQLIRAGKDKGLSKL